jgi:zinc transport system permease protein
MITEFFSFLQYDFMLRAFAAGIAIAIIAPLIGSFIILRRYALLADTLAHVSLVGIAVGLALGQTSLWWALLFAVIAAMSMEFIRQRSHFYGESILALFLSGSLAIAVVLASATRSFNTDLLSFLFGNITTVTKGDFFLTSALSAVVLVVMLVFYREFFTSAVDAELAAASGTPARRFNALLVTLAAVTVVVAIRVVGALLIGALMVIPALTASYWARSFRTTLLLAAGISLLSVTGGLIASFHLGLASGGSIVVLALFLFVLAAFTRRT